MRAFISIIFIFISFTTLANNVEKYPYSLFSPQQGEQAFEKIYSAISTANDYVHITVYSWSDKNLSKAIIAAQENGAQVRVILHRPLAKKERVKTMMNEIEAAGAQVKIASKNMHEKFIIIDDSFLVNSSANFSGGAKSRYSENFIFHKNTSLNQENLISSFIHEFTLMWNSSKDYISNQEEPSEFLLSYKQYIDDNILNFPSETNPTLLSSSMNFNFKIKNKGSNALKMYKRKVDNKHTWTVRDSIIKSIDEAQSTIYLCLNHFNIREISQALIKAVERGVDVKLAVDNQEFKTKPNNKEMTPEFVRDYKKIKKGAIPVRIKFYSFAPSPRYWLLNHHKFILIDHKTENPLLYSGSYNLSRTAEQNQFDNMVIYKGQLFSKLINEFSGEFENQWSFNRTENDKIDDKKISSFLDLKNGTSIRLHSKEAFSLTWEEALKIRRTTSKLAKGMFYGIFKKRNCHYYNIKTNQFWGCPK